MTETTAGESWIEPHGHELPTDSDEWKQYLEDQRRLSKSRRRGGGVLRAILDALHALEQRVSALEAPQESGRD